MNKPDRNDKARYLTVPQIMSETNLCRGNVLRLAEEADALIRIGRAVRVNAERFYRYIEIEYKA
ncbi:hypothetical protein SAMN06297422_101199 [Lachnospiraceae bacterium]|jgi:hypothetical protein|nr:hypothetical protein SAMN06297422_101199 [Lachnospiraceae bacterium]